MNKETLSMGKNIKKSSNLSKESVISLQEIKLQPIKFNSLSAFWDDMRS